MDYQAVENLLWDLSVVKRIIRLFCNDIVIDMTKEYS